MKNVRNAIMKAVNDNLRQIQVEFSVNGMNVECYSKNSSAFLNRMFTSQGVTGLLEAKDWRAIDYVFPFVATFIDRICEKDSAPLTSISAMYMDIFQMTVDHNGDAEWTEQKIKDLKGYIKHLQDLLRGILG